MVHRWLLFQVYYFPLWHVTTYQKSSGDPNPGPDLKVDYQWFTEWCGKTLSVMFTSAKEEEEKKKTSILYLETMICSSSLYWEDRLEWSREYSRFRILGLGCYPLPAAIPSPVSASGTRTLSREGTFLVDHCWLP